MSKCVLVYVHCFDKGVSEMINLALRQELKSNLGINKLEVYLTHCLTGQLSLEKEETVMFMPLPKEKKCIKNVKWHYHTHTHAHTSAHTRSRTYTPHTPTHLG